MTFDWYLCFIACVLVLWTFSAPRDRNALHVVLMASIASELVVDIVTVHISAPWKLVVPGITEVATIAALIKWARNRTGYWQAALLTVAWLAHLGCYLDIALKTDFVYSRYETIIQLVAVAQLLVCYETLAHYGSSIAHGVRALAGHSASRVRPTGVAAMAVSGKTVALAKESPSVEKSRQP